MKRLLIIFIILIFSLDIFAEVSNQQFELGNAKRLLFETNRILEEKNNKIIVSEISDYDWFFVNDLKTNDYINRFKQLISESNIVQQKRERLDYIYNQKKLLQMSALIPNSLNLINVAVNARDPLKAIIAIGGTAVSSASNFLNQKQKEELELLEKQWELDDLQANIFTQMNGDLRTYLSRISKEYGFTNDDLNSQQTLKAFIKCLSEQDAKKRYSDLNQRQFKNELKILPEYWAELAKASYEIDKYREALDYVDNYEKYFVRTMHHDERYANIMQIKAYCLLQIGGDIDFTQLSDIADKILENTNLANWDRKYFCVELYKKCYEKTENRDYLVYAKELLIEVIQNVLDDYKKNLNDFYLGKFVRLDKEGIDEDIKRITDLKNERESFLKANKKKMGKGELEQYKKEISDYKKQIDECNKNKKEIDKLEFQLLPPNSILLYSLSKEYFDLISSNTDLNQLKSSHDFDNTQFRIIRDELENYLNSNYYQEKLFNKKNDEKNIEIKVDYNKQFLFWNKDDSLTITFPATYFTFTEDRFDEKQDKLFIMFNRDKCELNYKYEFKRGNNSDLSDSTVVFYIYTKSKIKTSAKYDNSNLPVIKVLFDSDSIPYKDPINVRINNTNDLMKMFDFE